MIDTIALLNRHNPTNNLWKSTSPLTVGNGEIAFTADITGLQTFYNEQKNANVPLCTMSQWGWHTSPTGENRDIFYTHNQVKKTKYYHNKKEVFYPVKKIEGNEKIYDWLRVNPHRLNLARVGFQWKGEEISPILITNINQKLDLYTGMLSSTFRLYGHFVTVNTMCHSNSDTLIFSINCDKEIWTNLSILIAFPYGSENISGSNWEHNDYHKTITIKKTQKQINFKRKLDNDSYNMVLNCEDDINFSEIGKHKFLISSKEKTLDFTISFSEKDIVDNLNFKLLIEETKKWWENFWNTTGMVELYKSKDRRAVELERRIVLSQYLLAIQSSGSMPPQETGLTVNSWYGKFHMEMYFWHTAYLPLWNNSNLLKRSLPWFKKNLHLAKENASINNYKGARWQKMIGVDGIDSPSKIAPLLVWQQPHIIFILDLLYEREKSMELINEYWEVIKETANFMCDFLVIGSDNKYHLLSPLIPAQENHNPNDTIDPVYELEYFYQTLKLAYKYGKMLNKPEVNHYNDIAENIADLPVINHLYPAHRNCPNTFSEFQKDHPSMVAALGVLSGERVDKNVMKKTLNKVMESWDFDTTWGWDFAMLAMTATRLNQPELAIDILLKDSPKNTYVESGNNYQVLRDDLPLYLPGNGSLLLAIALMTAGYNSCKEDLPGFPKNGNWTVSYKNIMPFPE